MLVAELISHETVARTKTSQRFGRKTLLAWTAFVLLGTGACACNGASVESNPASHTSTRTVSTSVSESLSTQTKIDGDKDNDVGVSQDDANNHAQLNYGRPASFAQKRVITALVKRYFEAALAEEGSKACSMIYSTLAEAIPEDYGQAPGPLYMRGAKTCAACMRLLFEHFHPLLALEVPRLRVTGIRLVEHHGYALLSFGALPERQISVAREGRVWRMSAIRDTELS